MHKLTFFPLGNADCLLIDLEIGHKMLVDFADMKDKSDDNDKRIDLSKALRDDLDQAERNHYEVVVFTHVDADHVKGSSSFFQFDHADGYKDDSRAVINELWVPAAVILEKGTSGDGRVIRQEARYRLKQGSGIRVFSSPGLLDDWLEKEGINPSDRRGLITDAGQLVPGYEKYSMGVEFFVHSPFATRSADGELLDRNKDSIALQATFRSGGSDTRVHLFADLTHDVLDDIVRITEYHGASDSARLDRLKWEVFKVPHHSSYLSLSSEKGENETEPIPRVGKLYEQYKTESRPILVSTSKPILPDTDDQPPHEQAATYYKRSVREAEVSGSYVVTMEYPDESDPQPLIIEIGSGGGTVRKRLISGIGPVVSSPTPRAGS